jgi:hypothetical protein
MRAGAGHASVSGTDGVKLVIKNMLMARKEGPYRPEVDGSDADGDHDPGGPSPDLISRMLHPFGETDIERNERTVGRVSKLTRDLKIPTSSMEARGLDAIVGKTPLRPVGPAVLSVYRLSSYSSR